MSKKSENRAQGEVFQIFPKEMDRRDFIKCSALLGGSLAAAAYFPRILYAANGQPFVFDVGDAYIQHLPENQIYSVCQQ